MRRPAHTLASLLLALAFTAATGSTGWHHHAAAAFGSGAASVGPSPAEHQPVRTDAGLCAACLLTSPEPPQGISLRPLLFSALLAPGSAPAPLPAHAARAHPPRAPPATA